MKKIAMIILTLFVAFQGAILAAEVVGTVDSVVTIASTVAIKAVDGTSSSVSYDALTTWPVGVTDPTTLVGKKVKVTTDDVTSKAVTVSEVVEAATVPAEAPAAPAVETEKVK